MTKFEVKLLIKLLEEKRGRTDDRIARHRLTKKDGVELSKDDMYDFGFSSGENLGYCVILNLLEEYLQEPGQGWKMVYGPEYTDREKEAFETSRKVDASGDPI